jgi:hypothetical protein
VHETHSRPDRQIAIEFQHGEVLRVFLVLPSATAGLRLDVLFLGFLRFARVAQFGAQSGQSPALMLEKRGRES